MIFNRLMKERSYDRKHMVSGNWILMLQEIQSYFLTFLCDWCCRWRCKHSHIQGEPEVCKKSPNNLSFQTKKSLKIGWKNSHILAIQVISSDPSQTQVIQNRYCFAILLWLFVDRSAVGLPAYFSVQLFLLPIKFSKCWMTFMVVIVQAAAAGFL